ncbi:endo-1,4-beta-xylanase [Duganella sp. PWIR1]
MQLSIELDGYQQSFEIADLTLQNYGPGVALTSLPRSTVRYPGDAPDAAWRSEAQARIEKLRKGDLQVKVARPDGKPLQGAEVEVRMTRNAFNWGTAITSKNLLADTPDGARYREVVAKYFNQVVFENEAKAKYWFSQPEERRASGIVQATASLRDHHITARGHVMVWPSWQHSSHLAPLKNDPAALRSSILQGIAAQTGALKGQFQEWDVVNEPYAHHDILDVLGKREMLDWFSAARAGAPDVRLFLNDYTMFHGSGKGSPSQSFFDTVAWLKQNGAQVDAIGEQAHIGGTPPGIPFVLERLDYFGKLGLPIQISEFDINSNDDGFKARYLRDFLTAIYSHPATVGFVQWGFWEGAHWFPVAALWNKDWTLRQHGEVYAELIGKTWRTDFSGVTGQGGVSSVRAYTGEYEVTVRYQGKTVKQTYTLTNSGGTVNITL